MDESDSKDQQNRKNSQSAERKSKSGKAKQSIDKDKKDDGDDKGRKSKSNERKSKSASKEKEKDGKKDDAGEKVKRSKSEEKKSKAAAKEKEADDKKDDNEAKSEPETSKPKSKKTKPLPDQDDTPKSDTNESEEEASDKSDIESPKPKKKKGDKKDDSDASDKSDAETPKTKKKKNDAEQSEEEEVKVKDADSSKKKKGKKKDDESEDDAKEKSGTDTVDEKAKDADSSKKKKGKKKDDESEDDAKEKNGTDTVDEKEKSVSSTESKQKKSKKPIDETIQPLKDPKETQESTEKPIIWTSKEMELESQQVANQKSDTDKSQGDNGSSPSENNAEDAENAVVRERLSKIRHSLDTTTIDRIDTLSGDVRRNSQLMVAVLQDRASDKGKSTRFTTTDGPKVSYDNMQRVSLKVTFSRISDIDTIGQQFAAEIFVQARWVEPLLKGKTEKELDEIPFTDCWDPQLVILNLVGGMEKDKLSIMVRYEEGEVPPVVTFMWNVKAVFMEALELEHFPFDTQELSVVLSSERPMDEIDLIPDTQSLSNVSPTAIRDAQEWKSFRHVDFTQDFRSSDFYNSSMHPVLIASGHVRRRLGFYVWNIFIVVFLIIGLSLTILSIDPTGNDRLGVTMTLFLTCVAFKLVVKTTLPHISYLTYLDIYVVFTLMYLAAQAAENAIISHLARFKNREKVIMYDEIAQSILIGLLLLFHAVFLIYIRLTAFSRRRLMEEKDHAYHLHAVNNKTNSQKKKPSLDDKMIDDFRFSLDSRKSTKESIDIFALSKREQSKQSATGEPHEWQMLDDDGNPRKTSHSQSVGTEDLLLGRRESRKPSTASSSFKIPDESPLVGQGEGQKDFIKSTSILKQPHDSSSRTSRQDIQINSEN